MKLTVAQITDLHVKSESNQEVKRLEAIVNFINQDQSIKSVLATGDLVDDGEDLRSYERLKQTLGGLNVPYYLLAGNHDLIPGMEQVFGGHTYLKTLSPFGDFLITPDHLPFDLVGINTVVNDHSYGQILAEQIQWLADIHETCSRSIVVMMHHPPVDKNDLEDSYLKDVVLHPNVWNAFELRNMALWRQHRPLWLKIKRVISGHFHMGIYLNEKGQNLVISPSVAPPFSILLDQTPILQNRGVFIGEKPSLTLHHWQYDAQTFENEFIEISSF